MSSASALPPLHRRLERRNRVVRILRLALPLTGALVLAALLIQIVVSSLGARFSVGNISVTPEAVVVEAPDYVGVLQDGSAYRISAISARAATGAPDMIELAEAKLVLDRIDGVQLSADAALARLDTTSQQTAVAGVADIGDSTGTTGTLEDSVFDFRAQVLTTSGPVAIDYADGTRVRSQGLVYDARSQVWTFSRAVVTLQSTPGEGDPASPPGAPMP